MYSYQPSRKDRSFSVDCSEFSIFHGHIRIQSIIFAQNNSISASKRIHRSPFFNGVSDESCSVSAPLTKSLLHSPFILRIRIESESSVSLVFGTDFTPALSEKIFAWKHALETAPFDGFLEVVPAFLTLTIHFDPFGITAAGPGVPAVKVGRWLQKQMAEAPPSFPQEAFQQPVMDVPVRYGHDFGPDLEAVAHTTGQTPEAIVSLHIASLHTVAFIGFAPGFPYLYGLPALLSVPRLATPRPRVPAGSVAIANTLTCIYPQASSGGWHLIGQTDMPLFDPMRPVPALLEPGTKIRFVPV